MKRCRVYEIYAQYRGGGFSVRSVDYSRGTHRWCYAVCATSVKQAYALAAREVFATDAQAMGVRRIEVDWWHRATAPGPGERIVAPYLRAAAP